MKQTGLMFKGELVRAILDGRKTQTRRVMKPQPATVERWKHGEPTLETSVNWTVMRDASGKGWSNCGPFRCPFGKPGDLIYVRETWMDLQGTGVEYISDGKLQRYAYAADTPPGSYGDECRKEYGLKWRPSIHMPKSAARIWLEITGVRVERLQDISETDAIAEGIERVDDFFGCACWKAYGEPDGADEVCPDDPIGSFRSLWDSTGGDWQANPWVWVIDFKRTNKPAAN